MPNHHRSRARIHTAASAVAAALALVLLIAVATSAAAGDPPVTAARTQSTQLVSRAADGGLPNGPSTNGVMSNDKRYSRVIAYESEASNIVGGDTNDAKDVFAVLRAGPIGNKGRPWKSGRTILVSRTRSGAPANGASYAASVDGSFHTKPTCVGFLSGASNLTAGDKNNQVDAFVRKLKARSPKLVSKPGGRQSSQPTTAVAVSGNCKLVAFVTGGKLYVTRVGGRPRRIKTRGAPGAPSFSTGLRNDLVFQARGGVYLAKNARGRARLVGRGGSNPAYNDIKRRTVAYEKTVGGHSQIAYHDLGKRERIISSFHGQRGNGDSRNPVIGNSGYYVTFETDAGNLQTSAAGTQGDDNGQTDTYLYTDTRKITLVQSVTDTGKPVPGGGANPSMSFYANYIVFDSPGRIDQGRGDRQVFLRYLGGL